MKQVLIVLPLILGLGCAPDPAPLAETEARFLDFLDAANAAGYIESGAVAQYEYRDLAAWNALLRERHEALLASIETLDEEKLPAADAKALAAIRVTLADYGEPGPAADESAALACKDATRKDLDRDDLSAALTACFSEIGNKLQFEGGTIDRGGALGLLSELEEPARRKALFDAFRPLWTAINSANEADSPYRRLLLLAAKEEATNASGAAGAARAIDVSIEEVERWLLQILTAWRDANPPELVEPWDYRYAVGEANRALAPALADQNLLALDHRYYLDLGVDLDALGVVYDIEARPDKSPLAYCDFLRRGRYVDGAWQPTIARVVGRYEESDLGGLNELVHENGHAVHISAIRNRPAFTDWTDTIFTEAFADVPSWSVYEPAWQRKYLDTELPLAMSLRALFGSVMLDVAWSLFEIRMLREPALDPNVLWTAITQEYLRIRPHPELAWWAARVQLVSNPGYMVNYGLGSVLTAEMRQATVAAIGPFDAGNPRWHEWTSEQLLRYGSEKSTRTLMAELLGRPLNADAVLAQLRRIN